MIRIREALIQQSSGLHLLEVNGADLGSIGCKDSWTWAKYICVVLGFIFILKFSHIAHYCFLTKSLVKKKSDTLYRPLNGKSEQTASGQ